MILNILPMPVMLADFRFAPYFEVAVSSSVGVGAVTRAENQDNFVVIDFDGRACHLLEQQPVCTQLDGWPAGHGRLAVLDGMGGHGHGREAAEALAEALLAMPPCDTLDQLASHLDAIHAELQGRLIYEDSDGDIAGRPGTTLTLLELRHGAAPLLYHVGDSRLYALDADGATPLTIDHVPATVAALAGRIDEAGWWQQVHGRHTPQIAQAFILGNAFADPAHLSDPLYALTPERLPGWLAHLADRRVLPLQPGLSYLMATDGFWSCTHPDHFVADWAALSGHGLDAAGMVDGLFAAIGALAPGRLQPDNLTALVVRPLARAADETALPVDAVQSVR